MIFKEDCKINWSKSTKDIYNHIRGLSPYPAAWCEFINESGDTIQVKIFESKIISENSEIEAVQNKPLSDDDVDLCLIPGAIFSDSKTFIDVKTKDGILRILSLQPAGKKRMDTQSLLNGYKINENCRFK